MLGVCNTKERGDLFLSLGLSVTLSAILPPPSPSIPNYTSDTYGNVPVSTELIFLDVELHVTKAFHVQKCGRGLYVDRGKSEE